MKQRKKIVAFYEKDYISRSPNRKDTTLAKDHKIDVRIHVPKKHMMIIAEAYSHFKIDKPDMKVGKSKFL